MPMILVKRREWNNDFPVINGIEQRFPLDEPFEVAPELLALMASSGIPYYDYTAPGEVTNTFTLDAEPGQGSSVLTAINGTVRRLLASTVIPVDEVLLKILDQAGIRYTRGRIGGAVKPNAPAPVVAPTPTPPPLPTPGVFTVAASALSGGAVNAFTGSVGSPRYGDRPLTGDGYTTQLFTVSGGNLLVGSDF